MSVHEARVVDVDLEPHPNADTLSVVKVGGYTVCVRTADWQDKRRGVYIEPDTLVDTEREEFSFLAGKSKHYRTRAKRLRGIPSFGFLIPAPIGANTGDDCWESLGLQRWQPSDGDNESGDNNQCVKAPSIRVGCVDGPEYSIGKYDLENIRKYRYLMTEGEEVVITEKLHGQNMRCLFHDGQVYVGSRSTWKEDVPMSDFWRSYRSAPGLAGLVENNPGYIVYGESYGNQPKFRYDCPPNERRFRAFDILDTANNRWLPWHEFLAACISYSIPACPVLHCGPLSFEQVNELSEGKSTLANHVREGCVVQPIIERNDIRLGRVKLKSVGAGYLEVS